MSKRIIQYLILLFVASLLALLQFSLVSALPWPWNNFNLLVVAFIFAFLTVGRDKAWLLAAAAGCFLDIWSFHPFGLSLLSLLFSAVIVYIILENVLTNRSMYSFLLLTAIAIISETFLYNIFLIILDWSGSASKFFLFSVSFWEALAWSLLLGLLVVGLFFNLLAMASRKLHPFFLKRR